MPTRLHSYQAQKLANQRSKLSDDHGHAIGKNPSLATRLRVEMAELDAKIRLHELFHKSEKKIESEIERLKAELDQAKTKSKKTELSLLLRSKKGILRKIKEKQKQI